MLQRNKLDRLLMGNIFCLGSYQQVWLQPTNTKGGSITVPLTSCLTGLDQSVLQIKTKIVSCHTADSKPVKQEVSGTAILPPLVFIPWFILFKSRLFFHAALFNHFPAQVRKFFLGTFFRKTRRNAKSSQLFSSHFLLSQIFDLASESI